jgi:hypothetical protein
MACLTNVVFPAPFGPRTAIAALDLEVHPVQDLHARVVPERHVLEPYERALAFGGGSRRLRTRQNMQLRWRSIVLRQFHNIFRRQLHLVVIHRF